MSDSKNVNLDAIFNTAAAGLGAAYEVSGAALNGLQNVKDVWAANNSDSRRNIGQYPGTGCMSYTPPTRCPYPYADDSYQYNPFGNSYMSQSYMTPPQPVGYYGFTDPNYGMASGYQQPYDFGNAFDNGGNWQR